jgi:hypothetical protein
MVEKIVKIVLTIFGFYNTIIFNDIDNNLSIVACGMEILTVKKALMMNFYHICITSF